MINNELIINYLYWGETPKFGGDIADDVQSN